MNRVESTRHTVSIALFVLGVVVFLLFWLALTPTQPLLAIAVGLAIELVAVIFFRRGK